MNTKIRSFTLRFTSEGASLQKVLNRYTIIRNNLLNFSKVFDNLAPEEKKELIKLLIKEVLYDQDNSKIRITLRQLPDIGLAINDTENISFDERIDWLPRLNDVRTWIMTNNHFEYHI